MGSATQLAVVTWLVAPAAAFGPAAGDTDIGVGARWRFDLKAAADLQDSMFGSAPSKGWLGGDHVASFQLSGRKYLWVFGNSLTNLSGSGARREGDAMSTCNYFPARTCAMPTNTFALWEAPPVTVQDPTPAGLDFHISFDKRSGQATSTLWPPGWGGSGHSPKMPRCTGCSLWQAPTQLFRTNSQCVAAGADGVLKDKGGCCSALDRCTGYCCHKEFYFKATAGIASLDGEKLLLLSQMGKESRVMPENGETYATYAISVSNAGGGVSPRDWLYKVDRMPDTHVWPWSAKNETHQFFHAIVRARDQAATDIVYILGSMGKYRVLAKADLADLLNLDWEKMLFWAKGGTWKPYVGGMMPELQPLWRFSSTEVSLHWDDHLGGWLVPEVDRETRVIMFRVATEITGPYKTHLVGRLPKNVMHSNLSHWDVRAVKSHPELTSARCHWVLSMVLYWQSELTPPPEPGLHYFPRFLCISGGGAVTATTVAPTTPAPAPTTTPAPAPTTTPAPAPTTTRNGMILENPMMDHMPEPEEGDVDCSPEYLKRIEDNMACSDMGDGCHSCSKRAEWIVKHNGDTISAAYSIVAADFPHGCGAVLHCKSELAQLATMRLATQAWTLSSPRLGGSLISQAPVLAFVLSSALLALLGVTAGAVRSRRSRPADSRGSAAGIEAGASQGALLLAEAQAEVEGGAVEQSGL